MPRVSDTPATASTSPVPPVDVPERPQHVLEHERRPEQGRGHGEDPPQQHRRRRPGETGEGDDAVYGGAGSQGPRGALDAALTVRGARRVGGEAGPGCRGAVGEGAAGCVLCWKRGEKE